MQTTRGASLSDAEETGGRSAVDPSAAAGGVPARGPARRRIAMLSSVAALVLAVDVITKVVVVDRLSDRPPIRLLGGLLTLRVTRNSGAAFSIGTGATVVFTLIAAIVIIAILRTARSLRSLPWAIVLGLLLGGATGNLADRLLRAPAPLQGHVVDWIELPHWPVFNIADSAIVCGGVLAVLLAARGYQLDGERAASGDTAPPHGTATSEAVTSESATSESATSEPAPEREPGAGAGAGAGAGGTGGVGAGGNDDTGAPGAPHSGEHGQKI